jgi:putative transposase
MANRAYRYRLYPDKEQAERIIKTAGCCRYIYNTFLDRRISAYKETGRMPNYGILCRGLVSLKKELLWLKEADSIALQQAVRDLDAAYENFFAGRAQFPKFKSKRRSGCSYRTVCVNGNIRVEDDCIILPKLGRVRAAVSRKAPEGWRLTSATVSAERDGTYHVSCLYEYKEDSVHRSLSEERAVGLDYKSDGLYISSEGKTCGSPKYFRRAQEKLRHEQRKLRHKKKGSRSREKQLRRIAKIHRHIAEQRKDFLHKESLLTAKAYDIVCVEDLDMKAVSNRDFGNGKAAMDNGWGMFLRMLEYKLHDRGGVLIRVDRWYPSSQLCHICGHRETSVKDLGIRRWTCPICGAVHDRDVNAAGNILKEGLRIYRETAAA